MNNFNAKEFITNIRERTFDPLVWVGSHPENISPQDKEISNLKGLILFQANKLDDLMRCIARIEENMETLSQ
jgi:hypothetical protein